MGAKSSKLRMLLSEYDRKRNYAEDLADDRKKQLYKKFPVLQEIEDERSKIGLRSMKRIIALGGDKEKLKLEMELEFKELKDKELRVYSDNNIPLDYLEPKYECSVCNDRGILVTGGKCNCLEQKLIEEYYDKSNMKNLLVKQNFETLDEEIYSSDPTSGINLVSQKDIMNTNIRIAKNFAENILNPSELSLVFYGPSGSGKTFISSCIADRAIRKGCTVMYKPCSELLMLASKNQFGKYEEEIIDEYDKLFSCDLLIIDDLGTELMNKFTVSEIYKIINARIVSGKKFIISTNLNPKQINEQYTSRVAYRLVESCRLLEFSGPNLRIAVLSGK